MAEPALLSEMCRICTTQKPKYRCPGCSVRTCSVPCFQRHKAWASCSGKRDPAKYMKKSELSTETAFDHDYNFLSGIERVIDAAERDVERRGMEKGERMDRGGRGFGRRDGGNDRTDETRLALREEARLRDAVGRAQVIWERAPKGMERRKMNQTHYLNRSKRIRWMVEWIHGDGSKRLCHLIENETIIDGYRAMVEPKEQRVPKKRKRSAGDDDAGHTEVQGEETQIDPPKDNRKEVVEKPDDSGDEGQTLNPSMPEVHPDALPTNPENHVGESQPDMLDGLEFYLLMAQTSGKYKVLIPLPPQTTLSEALHGRVVMEFPTIYVLSRTSAELADPFILESEYLGRMKKQEDVVGGVPSAATAIDTKVEMDRQAGGPETTSGQ